MRTKQEVYLDQSLDGLITLEANLVYDEHIRLLKNSLATYTQMGDYNNAFLIQKDIKLFMALIKQLGE